MNTLKARSTKNREITLDGTDLETLSRRLHGSVLPEGSREYEEARPVWNGMIETRPALIARCTGTPDVVACVEFALFPVGPEVMLLMPAYEAGRGADVIRFIREYMKTAPEELGLAGFYGTLPDEEEFPPKARGAEAFVLFGNYTGPQEKAEAIAGPLRRIFEPLVDLSGRMQYLEMQSALDAEYPNGRRYYWRSVFLDELTDDVVEILHRHGRNRISPLTTLDVWFLGGAVRRIAPEDTAFRQRQTHSMIAIESNWDDPAADRANIEWTRNVARDLEPFSKSGVYLNFGGSADEAQEMLAATSGGNYERLLEVKHRYDPDNLFG